MKKYIFSTKTKKCPHCFKKAKSVSELQLQPVLEQNEQTDSDHTVQAIVTVKIEFFELCFYFTENHISRFLYFDMCLLAFICTSAEWLQFSSILVFLSALKYSTSLPPTTCRLKSHHRDLKKMQANLLAIVARTYLSHSIIFCLLKKLFVLLIISSMYHTASFLLSLLHSTPPAFILINWPLKQSLCCYYTRY